MIEGYETVNLDNDTYNKLTAIFREKFNHIGLNISNITIENLTKEKNNNIYELIIELDNSETLHFCIRIDRKLESGYEIGNTYYSKSYNGLEFYISHRFETDYFLDVDTFFYILTKSPQGIINLVKNIKNNHSDNNINNLKRKIKKKMYNNFM